MSRTICEGLTVLEVGSGSMASSLVGMLFADNGARVVKLEPPEGDALRGGNPSGFKVWNRGKGSVVCDLRTPEGRDAALEQVRDTDVLVEAFGAGVADRFGIGYEALRQLNPALVYTSIKGFGSRGAYAHLKAYEGLVAAKSGAFTMSLMGGHRPGPSFVNVPRATVGAAHMAFQGTVAALIARERTGQGQRVEATMVQGQNPYDYAGLIHWRLMNERSGEFKPAAPRSGSGLLCTSDGRWVIIANNLPHQWRACLKAMDLEWIWEDPRFKDTPRIREPEHAQAFQDLLWKTFRERTYAEWLPLLLAEKDIAFELAGTSEEGLEHPQALHNGHVIEIGDPEVGKMRQVGPIARFTETSSVIGPPAPALGQDAALAANGRPAPSGKETEAPQHPLQGTTIVELGYFYAMPFGVALAASLGARVIKIENHDGDPERVNFLVPEAGAAKTMEGKESIAVDLLSPEGRRVFHQLIASADVFVNGFRPGWSTEMVAADRETLMKINPRLVYLHAAGYGDSGPYSHRPMYATTASAIAGSNHRHAGRWLDPALAADAGPEKLKQLSARVRGVADGDANAALGVCSALVLAIMEQRRTGEGQYVSTSMIGSNAYAYSDDFCSYEGKPPIPLADPELYGLHALYRLYEAKTGWVFLAAPKQKEWEAFCKGVGREDLVKDERFKTAEARRQHDESLIEALSALFAQRPAAEWEATLAPQGIGCVEVYERSNSEFFSEDPVMRDTGLVAEVKHPLFGKMLRHGLPSDLSETPGRLAPGCKIGQHTDALLAELGYSPQEVADLKAKRVVSSPA